MPQSDQNNTKGSKSVSGNTSDNTPNTAQSTALTIDEARKAILQLITATSEKSRIPLTDAIGRTTATDIHATTAIPPFSNSAMDGYAIRYQDLTTQQIFKIIGKSLAGHPFTGEIGANEAILITTGAAIPDAADAIVIKELATVNAESFTTSAEIKQGQYIRNTGDDITRGQLLINANTKLSAADIGLLSAQGIEHIDVFDLPRVGVFSTGDELRIPSEQLKHGEIFDSNRATIQAVLRNAGIDSIDLGICKDDPQALEAVMKSADELDFLLSSGGVSVGEADHVKDVLEANGALNFWKVAMKPGKPLVSGKLSTGATYFGLPGNPVSSMVTCVQFVIPAIQAFSGLKYCAPLTLQANCRDKLMKEPGRFEFQRGIAAINDNGVLIVSTTGLQDSHMLSSMSKANCFICLDQFASGAEVGDQVSVMLFDSLSGL